jgi:hypothetical protein
VNLILLAFSCRCKSVLVEASEMEVETTGEEEDTTVPFQTVGAAPLHLVKCQFMVTGKWIEDVKMAFNPDQMVHFKSYSATEIQPKVDVLVRILWSQLQPDHCSRVKDESKHKSWVWNFVRENLGRVAAVMILMQHIHDNLCGVVPKK